MKILIAITSTISGMRDGSNQAIRETYVKDIAQSANLDYKFFMGDGTPTGEDESELFLSLDAPEFSSHKTKVMEQRLEENQPLPIPMEDEIILQLPDDYIHVVYKTRAKLKWAVEHGYDFILSVFMDTFIHVPRLMLLDFEHEYTGDVGVRADWGEFVGGGSGILLSHRCAKLIANDKDNVKQWAEDWWVSGIMQKYGVKPFHDYRFSAIGKDWPNKENALITAHLYDTNLNKGAAYNPQVMREAYRISKIGEKTQ